MSQAPDEVSNAVESGEYYRDAMRWYSVLYHSPISERALLIILTSLAVFITLIALLSLFMLLPVRETKTTVIYTEDTLDTIATVHPMMQNPLDNPNEAVRLWLLEDFVRAWEAYDIDRQEFLHKRVWAQSAQPVYAQYVGWYRSAESPTIRYERHTKRIIEVRRVTVLEQSGLDGKANVVFVATEDATPEPRNSLWSADIAFRFSEIEVDQETGEITPMKFEVIGYESKQTG